MSKKFSTHSLIVLLLMMILAVLLCVSTASAAGEAIYVNGTSGNDSNDGFSWDTPKLTIKNATDSVSVNGLITIDDGVYSGAGNTNITINKNMTIQGLNPNATTIDGSNTDQIFAISSDASVNLLNLILTHGMAAGGGAIYNQGTLNLINCVVTNNTGTNGGGGIHNYYGNVTVVDSEITGNTVLSTSASGAGICNWYGTLVVIGSTLSGNRAAGSISSGGAIQNEQGTLTVVNSLIKDNFASNGGGGIYNYNALSSTVVNTTFSNNVAVAGGGILSAGSICIVTESIFANNHAQRGAGIFNSNTVLNVINSVFNGNIATVDGGAIWSSSSIVVGGCNFTDNTAAGNGGAIRIANDMVANGNAFVNNHAGGDGGGAIWSSGTAIVNFNRFADNTAPEGSAFYNSEGLVHAENNWWGSNDPDFDTLIRGRVNYSPWLYLNFTRDPVSIPQGSTSTLTASFNQNTDGVTVTAIDPEYGHIPDGTPVTFTTTLGNVGSKSVVKYTVNGIATAVLRADEAAGEAVVGVLADGQSLSSTVTITSSATNPDNTVNAASTVNTVGMQTTGAPVVPLALAVLGIVSGLAASRRRN